MTNSAPGGSETSENVKSLSEGSGEADPLTSSDPSGSSGSDGGGPAAGIESTTERHLTGTSGENEPERDDVPDDQARNPQ